MSKWLTSLQSITRTYFRHLVTQLARNSADNLRLKFSVAQPQKSCLFTSTRHANIPCSQTSAVTCIERQTLNVHKFSTPSRLLIPNKLTSTDSIKCTCTSALIVDDRYFTMTENRYLTGYAKLGTSSCKKCKQKIDKGALRIAKLVSNPFSEDSGDMKQWFHPDCIFETFVRARATTKKIEDPDDLEGFSDLEQADKDTILTLIKGFLAKAGSPGKKKTPSKTTPAKNKPATSTTPIKQEPKPGPSSESGSTSNGAGPVSTSSGKDDSFREFRRLCADIAEENSYTGKTAIVKKFIMKGSSGDGYEGNLYLLLKLLLPGVVKSVYNLNNKQLVKLFSQIFHTNQKAMLEDLDQGDVAETVKIFFEQSKVLPPQKKCNFTIQEVNHYLEDLTKVTKEDDQEKVLAKIAQRCTGNDLKMVIRLIKHDLRINAGAKHILDALDPNAYAAFQASRDLRDVVERVIENRESGDKPGLGKKLSVRASLMTPVLPMLAEACRSVGYAMKKCPNGFYAEIKYDGERVQLHKKGSHFQYFSRSLKPVLPHKVSHFKEYIPKAFPTGDDLILDAEVLLIDTNTGTPLPFGTLGKHKKEQFKDANVCLFVFDCLHLNGENIMDKPIKDRRKILQKEMIEIPNRILFSEMKHITEEDDLTDMMTRVFQEGLEGLVLKDVNSAYEPGKRHWLKIKKDYLNEGQMADSADLVVLGAFFGTGNKGGMMSVFLMGSYDPDSDKWCTVTKVGNGFDDSTLEKLQKELKMMKISKNASKVPDWLNVKKNMIPDFVSADPKSAPVWEIAGAEFSKAEVHTADGISIRFPRVTKVRDDKSWKEATDLPRLKELFKKSKDTSDIVIPGTKKGKGPGKSPAKKGKSSSGSDTDVDDDTNSNATPVKSKSSSVSSTPSKTATPSSGGGIMKFFSPKKEQSSPSKPTKRASENGDESSPAKKSKPECKYGSDCYQKNPDHLANFYHPPKVQQTSNGVLPNIFTGAKIFIPSDMKDYKTLRRYIIAFDGEVVPEFSRATATHAVVPSDYTGPAIKCEGVCVKDTWLWKCIKTKCLQPTEHFILGT
ncbi:DNA ligase 3-like [Mercenaria mercenaria]|uniref:DNA ligase 3-like n=1 Tax=Mercenaria mercenaria TaxID=6596 RepID=UPI00234F2D38|nr:DNA ligase 3-like [Mercenaria mercenaria]XP_053379768.1 DNA ligase 3-like [Mercenaria mercenaria]